MYEYHPKIRWEIENNDSKNKMSAVNERVKRLQKFKNDIAKRLRNVFAAQIKQYNKSHQSQKYKMSDLIMLTIKNLKQKRLNKKLSYKFVNLFRIVDKIRTQTYRLLLSIIYRIHNTFHVFLLKPYHNRDCDDTSKPFMQVLKLIDDNEL